MENKASFSNSFIKNIANSECDLFVIEYKSLKKSRQKNFCNDVVSFYARSSNGIDEIIYDEISYVHDNFGLLRIDSSFSLEKTIYFFESRGITIHNKSLEFELIDSMLEMIKKYTDLSLGDMKNFFKTKIALKEKFYFTIIDEKNIELVKTLTLISNSKTKQQNKFRIDFFKNGFKYGKKNYEYNEYNKNKVIKNLKTTIYYMLKSYSESVDVDLNLKNFDDTVEVLKLLNY